MLVKRVVLMKEMRIFGSYEAGVNTDDNKKLIYNSEYLEVYVNNELKYLIPSANIALMEVLDEPKDKKDGDGVKEESVGQDEGMALLPKTKRNSRTSSKT